MNEGSVLVIVPAHDEERVIQRCVRALRRADVRVRVVVVANGCTDATADRVRDLQDGDVELIELPQGGKAPAVRAGLARVGPEDVIAVVDADVELDEAALPALLESLRGERAMIGAPALRLDTEACSPLVRRYFRVWSREPHVRRDDIGARGIYAVNPAGLARLVQLPDVIADDGWARAMFAPDERVVAAGTSTVRPPRTLRAQLRRRARVLAGNRELRAVLPPSSRPAALPGAAPAAQRTLASRLTEDGPADTCAWYAIELPARLIDRWHRARGTSTPWGRDATSRS